MAHPPNTTTVFISSETGRPGVKTSLLKTALYNETLYNKAPGTMNLASSQQNLVLKELKMHKKSASGSFEVPYNNMIVTPFYLDLLFNGKAMPGVKNTSPLKTSWYTGTLL